MVRIVWPRDMGRHLALGRERVHRSNRPRVVEVRVRDELALFELNDLGLARYSRRGRLGRGGRRKLVKGLVLSLACLVGQHRVAIDLRTIQDLCLLPLGD